MSRHVARACFALLAAIALIPSAHSRDLEFYWIDTDGGAATLMIAPTGESLLFDTGFSQPAERDAKRIFAAIQKAGLKKLDGVVISHWHDDHVGGLAALAKMVPIGRFYDHGDGVDDADRARHDAFQALAGSKRTILKSGDTVPFGSVRVVVVKSEDSLPKPLPGSGPNPLCQSTVQMGAAAPENSRMVGLHLAYGSFKYLSLADLDWAKEMELVCPTNKLGTVNLYLVGRHGNLDDAGSPALLNAIKPQVVIVNNGARKGLGAQDRHDVQPVQVPGKTFDAIEKSHFLRLAKIPGVEGIWQQHLSLLDADPAHNAPPDMIANLEDGPGDQANWIHGSVSANGSFTIANPRTGFSKTYTPRK